MLNQYQKHKGIDHSTVSESPPNVHTIVIGHQPHQ